MTKKTIAAALLLMLWLVDGASAACSDAYYNSTRASRIAAIVAAMPTSATVIISNSHGESGYEPAYGQGNVLIDGHPVVFLGSAGATWQTFRDCFPWSAIAAKSPHNIVFQGSINDAVTGQCCNGATVNADGTAAFAQVIMGAINAARAIVSSPVIATDPPPESAAGIDGYTNHAAARVVYYVATLCGGTCSWQAFGWSGSAITSPLQFIDQYKLMAGGSCTGSDQSYVTPCVAAVGSTRDNVHFPHDGITAMFNNLSSIP